ncbi:MAG: PEP-CTERM sorting domain-containing protein [Phycisphaeraceae bacterium]
MEKRFKAIFTGVFAAASTLSAASASAGYDESLHSTPAWRGDASAVHIGWDVLEPNGFPPPIGAFGGVLLDDTTPDIGDTTILGARLQQLGTTFGHISSSGNYYSGFGEGWGADDLITAPTDLTSHGSGFTTIIFQITEQDLGFAPPVAGEDTDAVATVFGRTDITLNGLAPLEANFARGVNANDVSQWFAQWEIAGDPASVEIAFSNELAHTAIDFLEVDVLWSADGGQLIQTPTIVPEPTSAALLVMGGLAMLRRRRH